MPTPPTMRPPARTAPRRHVAQAGTRSGRCGPRRARPWPGYDTLSASQVVRRLESLGPDELRAVHRYEASHRNRRTILNRAHQPPRELRSPPRGPVTAHGRFGV